MFKSSGSVAAKMAAGAAVIVALGLMGAAAVQMALAFQASIGQRLDGPSSARERVSAHHRHLG